MSGSEAKYQLKLSLNVLEHLGINLYSNVPSVLSEIVANAWDADATEVLISLSTDLDAIEIFDNGIGMTMDEVNSRFLRVGHQRRKQQGRLTALGREPMGRKGIGKLSLFSIAEVIEVYTAKDGEKNGFKMRLSDIRKAISEDKESTYEPEVMPTDNVKFDHGTRITITGVRKKKTIRTALALRKKIARRFSIIGEKENFQVVVNDAPITSADRDYYNKLQFLWTYGDQAEVIKLCCKNLINHPRDISSIANGEGISVTGWIGTVQESGQLKDEENGDNLNRLAIYVRGKMAQEDILADFGEQGVYASYLIGEVRFDQLDNDDEEDAATSNRQRFIEDDHRYIKLKEFLYQELKIIQGQWTSLRTDDGAKKVLEIPELKEWVYNLPQRQQRLAKSWLGKIYRLKTNNESERRQLLKYSVLAFEFHRTKENLASLENIDDQNLQTIMSFFKELDTLEEVFYGQIVKQRVSIIEKLQEKIDDNNKEHVVRDYLFDHLWLLDPHWERIENEKFMESRVGTVFEDSNATLSQGERLARVDIKYRQTAGTHVVIELKRPDVTTTSSQLINQLTKYRTGIKKLLSDQKRTREPLVFIVLLGKQPSDWYEPDGPKTVTDLLKAIDARVVLYDELLNNAYNCYKDYLSKSKEVQALEKIIDAIDANEGDE